MAYHDLAKMTTATVGTGTITLGAASNGFLTFALAGVRDQEVVSYGIFDPVTLASEAGHGLYSSSGTSLTRTPVASSNSGNPISLSGQAVVVLTVLAEDLAPNITAATALMAGVNYDADTSSGSFSCPLPANPVKGNVIGIRDITGSFGTYPLTIQRNGKTIADRADDLVANIPATSFVLVYNGTTWTLF